MAWNFSSPSRYNFSSGGISPFQSPPASPQPQQLAMVAPAVAPAMPSAAYMETLRPADSGEALEGEKTHLDGVGSSLLAPLPVSEARRNIQVVSLGSYCGVKMSARRLGLGEASLPFDWIRTRAEGVHHWLKHGFGTLFHVQHFYDLQHQGAPLTVYRSNVHSFWHDNIQDEAVRDKLWRRVKRFERLAQGDDFRALLFVRVLAGSQELSQMEGLLDILKQKFEKGGRQVYLLVIIDDQPLVGPILVAQQPGMLVWVQPLFQGTLAMDSPAPFEEAIACGVRYFLRESSQDSGAWPAVETVADITEPGSPFREAGLKDTGAGLIAGNVLLKGQSQELMFAAFEGLGDSATPSTPPVPGGPALPLASPSSVQQMPPASPSPVQQMHVATSSMSPASPASTGSPVAANHVAYTAPAASIPYYSSSFYPGAALPSSMARSFTLPPALPGAHSSSGKVSSPIRHAASSSLMPPAVVAF